MQVALRGLALFFFGFFLVTRVLCRLGPKTASLPTQLLLSLLLLSLPLSSALVLPLLLLLLLFFVFSWSFG